MTTKKQRAKALNILAEHFQGVANNKKASADDALKAIVATIASLPLNEQDLALDILRTIPGIGELLSQLQQKFGYDTDAKAGNQFRGHAGFPSIPDDSTYLQRLNADNAAILQAIRDLRDGKLDLPQDGITPASKRNYQSQTERVVHSVKAALDRTLGRGNAKRQLSEAEDK